jgi:hypothetical protein
MTGLTEADRLKVAAPIRSIAHTGNLHEIVIVGRRRILSKR